MKIRLIPPIIICLLFLCLLQSSALAVWPSSCEELAAENLTGIGHKINDEYIYPDKKWAELWVQRNYGEDVIILSLQSDSSTNYVYIEQLLDGYSFLGFRTWEIQWIHNTLSNTLELSEGINTVSIQVVYLGNDAPYNSSYTLLGFLEPEETFHNLFEVHKYLKQDPRFVDSLAELQTLVPEGVTEIDLRDILGDEAMDVKDAFMLNSDICVILKSLQEDEGYEVIPIDLPNDTILSRTPVPYAEDQYLCSDSGKEGNVLELWIASQENRPRLGDEPWEDTIIYSYIKINVSPDGIVDVGELLPNRLITMPDGKTMIHDAEDGELYAIDIETGEEKRLNIPYHEYDEGLSVRDFLVIKPLDEHRLVYSIFCWEWYAGYGIYDLKTHTNHRITGDGAFFGVRGNTLFGEFLQTDADTYEASLLPKPVQEQLAETTHMETGHLVHCDISPNGNLLALAGMNRVYNLRYPNMELDSRYSHALTITDIQTGDIVKSFDIYNPLASESTISFIDDTRVMLFYAPEDLGSAFIYLFDIEE